MKNRTKKILSGIALGVVGTLTLTGCTSDLTFNQADLDNIINGANKYLEYQNNYSSEYAQNMLNDLLIQAKTDYTYATSFTLEQTYQIFDKFGNNTYTINELERSYYDASTNTRKIEVISADSESNNSDNYYVIKYAQDNYTCTKYNIQDSEYTNMTNKDNINNIGYQEVNTLINQIFLLLNADYGDVQSNTILNTLDENHYQFKVIIYNRHSSTEEVDEETITHDSIHSEYYTFEFKDRHLTKLSCIQSTNYDYGIEVDNSFIDMEFILNTGDFNPITSNCTTEVPEEVPDIDSGE